MNRTYMEREERTDKVVIQRTNQNAKYQNEQEKRMVSFLVDDALLKVVHSNENKSAFVLQRRNRRCVYDV